MPLNAPVKVLSPFCSSSGYGYTNGLCCFFAVLKEIMKTYCVAIYTEYCGSAQLLSTTALFE